MRSVICFEQAKQAALYFDRVFPFPLGPWNSDEVVVGDPSKPEVVPLPVILNLMLGTTAKPGTGSYFADLRRAHDLILYPSLAYLLHIVEKIEEAAPAQRNRLLESVRRGVSWPEVIPLLLQSDNYNELVLRVSDVTRTPRPHLLLPRTERPSEEEDTEDPVISLIDLNLIDTSGASWAQIVELRSDAEAMRRLARLRSFISKNYAQKSRAFIEDDLSAVVHDYEVTRKKHGFDVVATSLTTILDAASLQAAAAAGLIAAIFGGPWAGLTSAATLEIGKFALQIAKQRRFMQDWHACHPIAYVIDSRRTLGDA